MNDLTADFKHYVGAKVTGICIERIAREYDGRANDSRVIFHFDNGHILHVPEDCLSLHEASAAVCQFRGCGESTFADAIDYLSEKAKSR